jgi:DNA (cytosine-5)-methyltransferase 1
MIPIAVELFCGCGGMSTGLLDAGIQVVAGFDNNSPSITAFNYNHEYRGARGFVADLETADPDAMRVAADIPDAIDLIAGGPPCQPFSIAGKQRGLGDKRGNLIFRFAAYVEAFKPKAFLFENVPNLYRLNDGALVKQLSADLEALGYEVRYTVINAAEYGVPQMRKRFVMVGVPQGVSFRFPEPTHGEAADLFDGVKPYITAADAIGDLPDVTDPASREIPNHEPTMHSEAMVEAFKILKPGTRDKKSYHDRLHPNRLGYTLRAGSGNFSPLRPVHYKYDRVITVRESARLQGMSDDFVWPDPLPRLQQYRQVGNAVPPPLAHAIGTQIGRILGWELDPAAARGNPNTRPPAFHLSAEERHSSRLERLRGASLGKSKVSAAARD